MTTLPRGGCESTIPAVASSAGVCYIFPTICCTAIIH